MVSEYGMLEPYWSLWQERHACVGNELWVDQVCGVRMLPVNWYRPRYHIRDIQTDGE